MKTPGHSGRQGGASSIAALAAENARGTPAGTGRRSRLYLWLRDHHDRLADVFRQNGPSWSRVAAYLAESGVLGEEQSAPAPETVRSAWYRVRRDVAAARTRRAGLAPGEPPAAAARAVNASPIPVESRGDAFEPAPRPVLEAPPARPRFDPEYREPGRPMFSGPAKLRSRMPVPREEE